MGAYPFEYLTAKSAGVKGLFNVTPVEILGNGKATGVKFIRTRSENDQLVNIPDSEFIIPCDLVIKATGQAKQGHFLNKIKDLKLDDRQRIIVNEQFQCSNPKYFAGGDAVNGGAEVVNGAYEGKMAARGIDRWLNFVESSSST